MSTDKTKGAAEKVIRRMIESIVTDDIIWHLGIAQRDPIVSEILGLIETVRLDIKWSR